MNHLLYISIIVIILGIILFTYIARKKNVFKCKIIYLHLKKLKDVPSKVFEKLFKDPSTWMGYSDIESGNFNLKE